MKVLDTYKADLETLPELGPSENRIGAVLNNPRTTEMNGITILPVRTISQPECTAITIMIYAKKPDEFGARAFRFAVFSAAGNQRYELRSSVRIAQG